MFQNCRTIRSSLWEACASAGGVCGAARGVGVGCDGLLDDPVFFAPFVPFFDPRIGRPSTPMETYLRLMFLKFRYRLGYESLCREVSDSITWRRFCRIPLDGSVPHPTTLMKLTTRCGGARSTGSTRRCWPRRPRRSCCAPTGYAPTPRWCRRMWPIRPIRGFGKAVRRIGATASGFGPPAARGAPRCGTVAGGGRARTDRPASGPRAPVGADWTQAALPQEDR